MFFVTQSNLSGHMLKWQQMVHIAKENDCEVILDACQSIAHQQIDTKMNNIDWIAFSGHKMFASTGVGVLFIEADSKYGITYRRWNC